MVITGSNWSHLVSAGHTYLLEGHVDDGHHHVDEHHVDHDGEDEEDDGGEHVGVLDGAKVEFACCEEISTRGPDSIGIILVLKVLE